MKNHYGLSVVTALAAAGLALSAATVSASASTNGTVHLMVRTGARSVFISTSTGAFNEPFTVCRPLSGGSGWKDARQELQLGKNVKLITFVSTDCTAGYLVSRNFTVPSATSSNDFWADMT